MVHGFSFSFVWRYCSTRRKRISFIGHFSTGSVTIERSKGVAWPNIYGGIRHRKSRPLRQSFRYIPKLAFGKIVERQEVYGTDEFRHFLIILLIMNACITTNFCTFKKQIVRHGKERVRITPTKARFLRFYYPICISKIYQKNVRGNISHRVFASGLYATAQQYVRIDSLRNKQSVSALHQYSAKYILMNSLMRHWCDTSAHERMLAQQLTRYCRTCKKDNYASRIEVR